MARRVAPGAVLLAVLPLVAGPAAGAAGAARERAPAIDWERCAPALPFDCGRVDVPLDHDRPDGPTVSLALARLPATDRKHRIGSLFINPGGPGGSGTDELFEVGPYLSQAVGGRFDIIGFDPRGVAGSSPLTCFDTVADQLDALAPWAFPVGAAQVAAQQRYDRRLAKACARHGGPILDHLSTADVARDLDLLRRAVGDRRLSYVGTSYGTQLGEVYANLFPQKVRAMVLDSVIDPVAWTTGRPDTSEASTLPFSTRLRSDKGATATLEQFFRRCDAAATDAAELTDCAFGPGSKRRYAELAGRLRDQPLRFDDSTSFGYADLVGSTLGALYSPYSWRDLAAFLQALWMATGPLPVPEAAVEAAGLARGTLAARLGLTARRRAAAATGEQVNQILEGFAGVACADSVNPDEYGAWPKAAAWARRDGGGYFADIWTWASSPCQPWRGRGEDAYRGPWSARTSGPVLVVGTRYDPATRYRSAVDLASLMPGARLLTYEGWGHGAFMFGQNGCVDATVARYLVSGKVPSRDLSCRPELDPFEVTVITPGDAARSLDARDLPSPAPRPGPVPGLPPAARRALVPTTS